MVNLAAQELGKLIGQGLKNASNYTETFVESEDATDILLANLESVNLVGSYFVYSKTLSGSAFVLDHVYYGYIDSSIFRLDTGYSSSTLSYSGFL